ncbi:MAG TPA: DUF1501 domain-containing protein [Lacipirellula sp.]
MDPKREYLQALTRRHFLRRCQVGLGGIGLASLLGDLSAHAAPADNPLATRPPKLQAKAKKVIFLHMAGGPSHLELLDYKPELVKRNGQDCPSTLLEGQRFAFIKGTPKLLGTPYRFTRHGRNGAWFSELLPHLARVADDLTIVKSMTTEQFNHAPAQLLMQTGNQLLGHPSLGAWATYGLARSTRTCRGSWSSSPKATRPTPARASGGAATCPAFTKACSAAIRAIRFCLSITRPA